MSYSESESDFCNFDIFSVSKSESESDDSESDFS